MAADDPAPRNLLNTGRIAIAPCSMPRWSSRLDVILSAPAFSECTCAQAHEVAFIPDLTAFEGNFKTVTRGRRGNTEWRAG